MYLRALEIQGFKSFPDKTRISFEKDITAIVGPNGSGKSNISDAILWVMGEQRSKALRGSKMEDVIFGGTEKRSPLGFAQVSLILDNSAHIFPSESPEIMLTRRYYRSGESEYSINRQPVRLKDIHSLLMDTGLGRDGYSIIGQGRIAEIVSSKSTDRREVFEEAAGISRYRYRKEEAEHKLEKTEENLLRSGFERPNLSYIVRKTQDKIGQVRSVCAGVEGSGIVYVRSRARAQDLAESLKAAGISASYYHAGLGALSRADRQKDWKEGRTRVMVCTNAFGMGIDKPDVRFVVHADIPDSPEAYFQEAGRAGRDGKPSYAVLLWNGTDTARLRQLEEVSFPSLESMEEVYQKIHIFFQIPYDEGEGRMLKLDVKEFCKHYKLQLSPVYYAIKYMEREGHWTLSEDMDIPTRVKIDVDRAALYHTDLPDPAMPQVLETLMRLYTGVFSYPVSIDEEAVAARCGVSIPALRQLLYGLSVNHVIRYIPADHATVLFLQHGRLRPGNVQLSPQRYKLLRSTFAERAQAMTEYVEEEDTCRSRFLLKYFGQQESEPCGRCDICRAAKARPADLAARLKAWIGERKGQYTLKEVAAAFGTADESYLPVLRELIDRKEVPHHQ